MTNKRLFSLIFLIFLSIALIHGVLIEESLNLFFSWLFIGIWICYSIKFIQTVKSYREFNSPHNTSFFVLGTLFFGIFFAFWGYFTGLLEYNLFEDLDISLYLSFWTMIFALPYLSYGFYILYSCFKRFEVVYMFKDKSISSRKFAVFFTIFLMIFVVAIMITVGMYWDVPALTPIHLTPDLLYILFAFFSFILLIRYGIFGTKPSLPQVSPELIARRRNRITSMSVPPAIASTRRQKPATATASRSSPRSRRPTTVSASKTKAAKKTAKPKINYEQLKPKAGALTIDDFKCIFCFKLPDLSNDKGRGIILCPSCKHPAHADEWKDWLSNSPLCSRCDASIPSQFQRRPKIISVKDYVQAINIFSKKGK